LDNHFIGIAGIAMLLGIAVLLSSNRRHIQLRVVAAAFALQAGIAFLVLYVPAGKAVIAAMAGGVANLLGYAQAGIDFLFGPFGDPGKFGFAFAIHTLPIIIFFAALVSILYYFGIMQFIVKWLGGAIQWVTGISKIESLGAAANIFVGQSEAPLVIRPYLASMTPAQIFTIMTVGMAGVAGTILAAYATMLGNEMLPYLLAASFMSAPGGILMAKLIMPDEPGQLGIDANIDGAIRFGEEKPANVIMAAAEGAQTGVKIAVAVGAMVLAFVALVALANGLLGGIGNQLGYPGWSFQAALGQLFKPLMFLLGVPWSETDLAGGLFGTKLVLNEFVGFQMLGPLKAQLPARTVAIITFALCGFANFLSIAIQMAVTGGLAPNQRPVIAKLGLKALAAGSLANLMSAALAGLMITA
jgi:concentrative nucleoside transporter, CNT family